MSYKSIFFLVFAVLIGILAVACQDTGNITNPDSGNKLNRLDDPGDEVELCFGDDETAWAGAESFRGRSWAKYFMFDPANGTQQFELYAGQTEYVGYVEISDDGNGNLTVSYNLISSLYLTEYHFHAASSYSGLPQNRAGNPTIGRFQYSNEFEEYVQTYSFTIENYDGSTLYMAAHAVVVPLVECPPDEDDTEG